MRKQLAALVMAGSAAAGLVVAPDAHAADTTTTFSVTGGTIAISAPAATDLTASQVIHTTDSSIVAQLGNVTVTDTRGALNGTWSSDVDSTNFTTGAASGNETIAKSAVTYLEGVAVPTGVAVIHPRGNNLLTLADVGSLAARSFGASPLAAYSAAAVVGNNSATWNPVIAVSIPSGVVAGTYTGTITHSAA